MLTGNSPAQLLGVAKGLSRHARFSSVGVLGGSSIAAQAKRLNQPVDLVVATPGRLCSAQAVGFFLVIDCD